MLEKSLLKSKVTWTGIAGVVAALGGYFTGTLSPQEAIQGVFMSLIAIFFRDAMRKGE